MIKTDVLVKLQVYYEQTNVDEAPLRELLHEARDEITKLRELIEDSPAWPGTDVSVEEVLVFLGKWYGWREKAREALSE